MKLVLLLTLLFYSNLFSKNYIQKTYFISHNALLLSDIITKPKKNMTLYTLDFHKHTKRIKTSTLIKKLKENGYFDFIAQSSYVQIIKKSPVNTQNITEEIRKKYIQMYPNIKIKNISVYPRAYREFMPSSYTISLQKRFFLARTGIVYITTPQKKKIFFNYTIEAYVTIYRSKYKIKKGDEISQINTQKKSIMLEKFRARPLQDLKQVRVEAKHHIKEGFILTQRDVTGLYFIRRGAHIHITLNEVGMTLSVFAKALQNGRLHQSILALTQTGKKIKVVVTGRNRAQIEE